MKHQEIEQLIENMSEQELQAILDTQYPEELEKAAEAQLAAEDLAETLFAYGAVMADSEIQSADGDLSKEASAELEAAQSELESMVNSSVEVLGLAHIEDRVELHKESQAAAGLILAGYASQLAKLAAPEVGAHGGKREFLSAMEARMQKAKAAIKGKASAVAEHVKKHKGKYGVGAALGAGAIGAGLYAKKKKDGMQKKASELSVDDVASEVMVRMAEAEAISDGIEKMASEGATLGTKLKGMLESAKKHVGDKAGAASKYLKESPKLSHGLAAGGGATAGALAAHMLGKKKKKED